MSFFLPPTVSLFQFLIIFNKGIRPHFTAITHAVAIADDKIITTLLKHGATYDIYYFINIILILNITAIFKSHLCNRNIGMIKRMIEMVMPMNGKKGMAPLDLLASFMLSYWSSHCDYIPV